MNVSTKSYVCWSVDADMPLAIINLKHNGAGGTTEKFNSISIKLMSKFKLRQIKLNSILFGKNE